MILNEVLGVHKGVKQRANKDLGALQKQFAATPQMSGYMKTYTPINNDDPDVMPDEGVKVQFTAQDVWERIQTVWTDMVDVIYTREVGNTQAKADITVGDAVIASDVPVGMLIHLEKEVQDLLTIIGSMPVLDPAEEWVPEGTGIYRSKVEETRRTKKEPRSFEKAKATDKHAAQVEVYYEDTLKGFYKRTKFSGAMEAKDIQLLRRRAIALLKAVKQARERANSMELDPQKIGADILGYLTAPA